MKDETRDSIIRACERLCIDYAKHVDFRDYEKFAALFADDGELVLTPPGAKGPKAIRETIAQRPANRMSAHVCTNIAIDVIDENRANGTTYLTLYRYDAKEGEKPPARIPGPDAVGYYIDKFKKTEAGWRFAKREIRLGFLREGVSL